MIAALLRQPRAWAWIILGLALIGLELLAPGVFLLWLGLAAIATGLIDCGLRPLLAGCGDLLLRCSRWRPCCSAAP